MPDVIEVSYTGDLLAHRRCRRAWAYEKKVGFLPYEAVQAMEGRLIHHAMEWMTRQYREVRPGELPSREQTKLQLEHYFRVLWARGIRTAFSSKAETLKRVVDNLFPEGKMDPIVRAIIQGAEHTEYELRAVKKVLPADFDGKSKILLTGILDLVVQQQEPLTYERAWAWTSMEDLTGERVERRIQAQTGDVEIWDYKGTRATSIHVRDYVRQVLTYASLYRDRAGTLPVRCVLFFINEKSRPDRLLVIEVNDEIVGAALAWTQDQVRLLQKTSRLLQRDPHAVGAGELDLAGEIVGKRLTAESKAQCTACRQRFGCEEYAAYLKAGANHPDIDLLNVLKN